jgi:hypothetical protein
MNDSRVCGYAVTTSAASGNGLFRRKAAKHTNSPASGFTGEHSWTGSGLYAVHQTAALASGNLCYDPEKDSFCLSFPVASGEACVAYQSGTTEDAWYLNMPLNSRWPDLHLHYRKDESGLIPIASGDFIFAGSGIVVSGQERKAFSVWQSGQVVAVYDPGASGLVTFK